LISASVKRRLKKKTEQMELRKRQRTFYILKRAKRESGGGKEGIICTIGEKTSRENVELEKGNF